MTKKIPLGNSLFALIDDDDYPYISRFNWSISDGFVRSVFQTIQGWSHGINLAQFLIHKPRSSDFWLDHLDGNLLNFSKANLEYKRVGVKIHQKNKIPGTTSKYKWVYYDEKYNRWRAYISKNKKRYWLGSFREEEDAVKCFNRKSIELYGDQAFQNIIK